MLQLKTPYAIIYNPESAGLNNSFFLLKDPPEEISDYLRHAYHATQDMRAILQEFFTS